MSSIHGNNLPGVRLQDVAPQHGPGLQDALEDVALTNRAPVAGEGGLAGRHIRVGDGQRRGETVARAEKQQNAFMAGLKTVGKWGLKLIALPFQIAYGLTVKIPALVHNKILEPRSEKQFKLANAGMLRDLGQPRADGVLSREGVQARLVAHAQANGTPVTPQELREMVATGEHIAKALQGPGGDRLPLEVGVGGQRHTVQCNGYMARCVGWYMMAQAAAQDGARPADSTRTDMTSNGAFVMKDEGNRMYNFLRGAPTCGSRMSTHFEERVDHTDKHALLRSKVLQRGIEDYQSKMPGQGGTMLFDKLRGGELFVKFESGGCPPYFQKEANQGAGTGFFRMFAALDRNVGHAFSFLASRDAGGAERTGLRQEHVYKGVMKPIAKDFALLVERASNEGVIEADAKVVGKMVHKLGLPFVQDAIATIRDNARAMNNEATFRHCNEMVERINVMCADQGLASDVHGIERRGAEVHIGL